jgi:predicted amidophosphoribosyltransferase
MYAMYLREAVRSTEEALGHTHRCLSCRSTFVAYGDGCPICGNYMTYSASRRGCNNQIKEEKPWYYLIINHEGRAEYVFLGSSCPWPRS